MPGDLALALHPMESVFFAGVGEVFGMMVKFSMPTSMFMVDVGKYTSPMILWASFKIFYPTEELRMEN